MILHMKQDLVEIGIYINVCAANENINVIGRIIRLFKERHRCIRHCLPYACIPKLMVIE